MFVWVKQVSRKKSSACVIASFVLSLGLLIFVISYLAYLAKQRSTKQASDDHSDSMLDNCKSDITVITDETQMDKWDTFSANFSEAWSNVDQSMGKPVHKYMDQHHSFALFMYTNMHPPANQNIESGEKIEKQKKTFESCSAFSILSEAIQILKHSQVTCLSSNYSTETPLPVNISSKQIRFSSFVLVSDELNSTRNSSCFEIYSCFGADVTQYSASKRNNQVLIPPYEVFKVTDVHTDTDGCKVLYRLISNQNCVYDKESNMLHPISVPSPGNVWVIFSICFFLIVSVVLMCITARSYIKSTVKSASNLQVSAEVPPPWPVLG